MNVKEIYEELLKAKRPIDFFGDVQTETELKKIFKQYAKCVHPDIVKEDEKYIASEAFMLLNNLCNLGIKELEDGIYSITNPVEMYNHMDAMFEITVGGNSFKFYEYVYEGEVADVYKGASSDDIVYLKVAADPQDNELIDTEFEILSTLRHQSFPYVEREILVNDSKAILTREIKGITMPELMEQYKNGVPAEHVMWMLERLLSAVGYLHSNFVVHGNIKPENIVINKENHNVSLLGFSFAIPNAKSSNARYRILNEYYSAPEVSKDSIVMPSSDIYSIGKVAIELLGGSVKTGGMPIAVDSRVREFIRSMVCQHSYDRSNDAWKLWSELIELRNAVYGTERFKKLA